MDALKEAGYQAVTIPQVIDYVENGAPLPARPILITMDDGYGSNLDAAAPILEETGMCATVFAIGINEGEEYYPHSGEPMWQERFAFEKAAPWVEKGVIDVHTSAPADGAGWCRSTVDTQYPRSEPAGAGSGTARPVVSSLIFSDA